MYMYSWRKNLEPAGLVPVVTVTAGIEKSGFEPSLWRTVWLLPTKASAPAWKHSSVRGSEAGHRRYW